MATQNNLTSQISVRFPGNVKLSVMYHTVYYTTRTHPNLVSSFHATYKSLNRYLSLHILRAKTLFYRKVEEVSKRTAENPILLLYTKQTTVRQQITTTTKNLSLKRFCLTILGRKCPHGEAAPKKQRRKVQLVPNATERAQASCNGRFKRTKKLKNCPASKQKNY